MRKNMEIFEEQNRLLELRSKAKDKAYSQLWCNAYKDHFMVNSDQLTDLCSITDTTIMDNYIRKCRRGIKYAFFTINPRDDVTFTDFKRKIEKSLKKTWVGDYIYCYEQRAELTDNLGVGIHVHMLIKLKKYKRPSDCKREMYNTFKHLVGNSQHINMKSGMDCENFLKYIHGIKKDDYKEKLMEMDRLFRERLGLKKVYTNNIDWEALPSGEGRIAPPLQ